MLSRTTWRARRLLDRNEQRHSRDRILDFGVRLYTVEQHPDGVEVQPGRPPVRSTGYQQFGGLLDTRSFEFVGPSRNPVVLFASADQARLIVHDRSEFPTRVLTYGAEGAGKTRGVLAPWLLLRALEFTGIPGAEIGGTAPVEKRLGRLRQALFEIMPPEWYTFWAKDGLFVLRNGVAIRLQAAKAYSADTGSPIQGWDWVACGSDELQDSIHANDDIETRGRRAIGGEYLRMNTATAKDHPTWRTFRDGIAANPMWQIDRLPGFTNPFVFPEHWKNLEATLSPRAYARRVLAQDVAPENASYYTFDRDENVQPVPRIGAEDVTRTVLGGNHEILLGHDPGNTVDVTLFLKAYRMRGARTHRWYVVGELTTERTTTDEHVRQVLRRLRDEWACNLLDRKGRPVEGGPTALVRADPYSETSDKKTDREVYTTWRNHGLRTIPAAYSKNGTGPGKVPKNAGIEMVVGMLCAADKETRRLFIACDERRQPVAPRLVEALEMSERDEAGEAETGKKGPNDLSHWPAALRYALWALERPRIGDSLEEGAA